MKVIAGRNWGFYLEIKLETLCCLMREMGSEIPICDHHYHFSMKIRFRDTGDTQLSQDSLNRCREAFPASCLPVCKGTPLLSLLCSSSGNKGVNTMCLARIHASFAYLPGPLGGNCPHHSRFCSGKIGTGGIHRPQFFWKMCSHAALAGLLLVLYLKRPSSSCPVNYISFL